MTLVNLYKSVIRFGQIWYPDSIKKVKIIAICTSIKKVRNERRIE